MMSKVEEKKEEISRKKYHRNIRWMLVLYDLVVYAAVAAILLIFYCGSERLTGIGIPEEHQERIFERFYRVDKSHSKERGGTGLGLSIVKHGAILHGAKVTVSSEPGKGTKIEIRFPKEKKMKKAEVL